MAPRLKLMAVLSVIVVLCAVTASADAQTGQPGCVKDIECKGNRICEDRKCVSPPATPPVTPELSAEDGIAPMLVPEDAGFYRYYLSLGWAPFAVQIMDWNDEWDRGDRGTVSLFPFNFRLAGYGALSENAYLGAFFLYEKFVAHGDSINSMNTVAIGLAGRFGGRTDNTTWVGINLDAGITLYRNGTLKSNSRWTGTQFVTDNDLRTTDYSLYLYPAFTLVSVFGSGKGLKGGIELMLGIEIFVSEQASLKDHGAYQHFSFGPAIRLGFLLGGI